MTHTPGPWRVHSEHADRIIVNGCCVYQVRDMTTEDGFAGNGYGKPNPVDVQLMAAAPDLLAALKAHLPWREEPVQGWGMWADAVDAIAKAEGRCE